ncbi:MAG: hypothetical protein ACE5K4_07815 [Candidatus Hydrothermarchaeota archaeon]
MKKIFSLIFFLTFILVFPSVSQEIENGSIFVEVEGYDKSSYINASLMDSNHKYLENKTVNTSSFSFDNLKIGEKYYILLKFKSIPYLMPVDLKSREQKVKFRVFDTTRSANDIIVNIHHIVVQPEENKIKVKEIVVFRNEGNKAYNGNELRVNLPPEYLNFRTSIMECCIIKEEEGFTFDPMQAIKPNETYQIDFYYELIPQNKDYKFERKLNYKTNFLMLLIEKNSISSKNAENLIRRGELTFENKQYSSFESLNLKKGESVALVLSGFSTLPKKWIWIGEGLILFIILMAGFFSIKFRTSSAEDLIAKKEAAFAVLNALEKDYKEGRISEEDYEELKSKYEEEVSEILKKIEKMTKEEEGD